MFRFGCASVVARARARKLTKECDRKVLQRNRMVARDSSQAQFNLAKVNGFMFQIEDRSSFASFLQVNSLARSQSGYSEAQIGHGCNLSSALAMATTSGSSGGRVSFSEPMSELSVKDDVMEVSPDTENGKIPLSWPLSHTRSN